jgi:hypothetical protein
MRKGVVVSMKNRCEVIGAQNSYKLNSELRNILVNLHAGTRAVAGFSHSYAVCTRRRIAVDELGFEIGGFQAMTNITLGT